MGEHADRVRAKMRNRLSPDEQAAATRALKHAHANGLPQAHHDRLKKAVDDHLVHELDGPHQDLLGQVIENHMDTDHMFDKHRKAGRDLIERHDLSHNPVEHTLAEQEGLDEEVSVGVGGEHRRDRPE